MRDCCKVNKYTKKCIRIKDKKIFMLPRKFSRKKCLNSKIRGFTMRASCSPYKFCKNTYINILVCLNVYHLKQYHVIKYFQKIRR